MEYSIRNTSYLLFILVLCFGISSSFDISKHLKICNRDSPEVDACLKSAIQTAMSGVMTSGIPEIVFPSLDPFLEDDVRVSYKSNLVRVKMLMKNIRSTGLAKSKIKAVRSKLDEDQFHLEVDMATPSLYITGDYEGQGGYNALNVDAKGEFNCSMKRLKYTWKLDGHPETRDGKTYVNIYSFYMRPDIQSLEAYASNIFPNNPQLTEQANRIALQNWRFLYQELLPIVQNNWNKTGIKVGNQLFSKVPYEELFPIAP